MPSPYLVTTDHLGNLDQLVGQEVGPTDWLDVEQGLVDRFADVAHDRHWIHNDPERAEDGPFGGPIAHAHLTLALMPWFGRQLIVFDDGDASLFYGYERVRFPAPVPVGGRIRARGVVLDAHEAGGAVQLTLEVAIGNDGQDRPACVAQALWRHYPGIAG